MIRSHTTFDDLDVIGHRGVSKVKLHGALNFFDKFLFDNIEVLYDFKFVNGPLPIAFLEFDMHLRKVINYAFTNSKKNFYFGSFLNRFLGEIFQTVP